MTTKEEKAWYDDLEYVEKISHGPSPSSRLLEVEEMTPEEMAREFLNELNQIITKTDLSIIRQAKTNVQIRTQRASTAGENLELWYRLMDLLDACEKCKRVIQ